MNKTNMIKSVTMVSDTDSTIISVDAWYRFIVEQMNGEELRIANYCPDPITFTNDKEWMKVVSFEPKQLDYNFNTDEIVELDKWSHPDIIPANDNVRYSIISIMTYILDHTVNDYMIRMCTNQFSVKDPYHMPKECKIWAKTEFLGVVFIVIYYIHHLEYLKFKYSR